MRVAGAYSLILDSGGRRKFRVSSFKFQVSSSETEGSEVLTWNLKLETRNLSVGHWTLDILRLRPLSNAPVQEKQNGD
jgi:hypothetical protein